MSQVLVLGGSRSGKSALRRALLDGVEGVTYLATSTVSRADAEWAARVAAHRARRPAAWTTVETTAPSELVGGGPLLVDSMTTWVAALMDEAGCGTSSPVGRPAGRPRRRAVAERGPLSTTG